MLKLRVGYLLTGVAIGLILLINFLWSLPDGKLHVVFCNVGQGDAAYIRFPDGRDMLIDGGPNDKVLGCLGKHMPFWDRSLDLVVLSHPQKDHMQGLISVLERYTVKYFVRSDIDNPSEGFQKLTRLIKQKRVNEKLVIIGENITIGSVNLTVLWPSSDQIARMNITSNSVLGASVPSNLNDGSVVVWLRYGSFDVLFPGDADNHVNQNFIGVQPTSNTVEGLADDTLEVLKVPHHGSKTGMSQAFIEWLYPRVAKSDCAADRNITIQQYSNCPVAVISVGKNSYGHPAPEILEMLRTKDIKILRTDEKGDIDLVSDGRARQTRFSVSAGTK
ncbi:MBL fold metallo-hydrolase [Patescibacteria group bacterium]|nr:MBL fold metallo-hydrolase [Patescibacteria group bacterium]MBU2459871.1 MBL fold metallo-hydrolase [Patescibacteria group bacterium]